MTRNVLAAAVYGEWARTAAAEQTDVDRITAALRADGHLLVSEAELATALRELDENWQFVFPDEVAADLFAALVAAQEKGETGS